MLVGAFGLPKHKGGEKSQRFIFNLQKCIRELSKVDELSNPALPYASIFTISQVNEGKILVSGTEDECASFYQYKLPKV